MQCLKLETDIIEVLIVIYRLKDWLLESGSKVGIAHFEISKFCWHATSNEFFLFATPPRSWSLILWLHERHTLLSKSSIFDSSLRITIFGAPWHKAYRTWSWPWKVRGLGKTERPAANSWNHNSPDRLPSITNIEFKKHWNPNSHLLKTLKSLQFENFG